MSRFRFTGRRTREISFPLGGVGTGCVGLAGNGHLIDWEIFNRPNKGGNFGFTHFAIRAEREGKTVDWRVIQGDDHAPFNVFSDGHVRDYGRGYPRRFLAGAPHFADHEFEGYFPFANVRLRDPCFPGSVELSAFNPFIPMNDRDSGIPAAFFTVNITNTTTEETDYVIALTGANPAAGAGGINRTFRTERGTGIFFAPAEPNPESPEYGDLTIMTDASECSCQSEWYRGRSFEPLETYFRDIARPGPLNDRTYEDPYPYRKKSEYHQEGTLAAHVTVVPGASVAVRYVLAWNVPNFVNYWKLGGEEESLWRNYYATLWEDSRASADYAILEWGRLERETRSFADALFDSTLPEEVVDAVSANISILKTPTCLRLENGSFYGFEGCCTDVGCCPGTCTHVWNYAYALPYLFPKLERSIRDIDFVYNTNDQGKMSFRTLLPLGREPWDSRACADGQFGNVIKAYRDWLISGDTDWLLGHYAAIKRALSYAWSSDNPDAWDPDQSGLLTGRQHHTLDTELFGANSWLSGYYVAALDAGAAIAEAADDPDFAELCTAIAERGRARLNSDLWNGEYYAQQIDLSDRSVLTRFDCEAEYWNDEAGEIRYQVGDGCMIDQVIADWHTALVGLPDVFNPAQRRRALESLYSHNFARQMRDVPNPCRVFSLNDEAGVMICTWPEGHRVPASMLSYGAETMTGFEYQFACSLIQNGLADEGFEVVRAIRDRFDGERRNPWNEFECGSNYARSMASYSLLVALSGFECDLRSGFIGFRPVPTSHWQGGAFRSFWSAGTAWGRVQVSGNRVRVEVLYGTLRIHRLGLPGEFVVDNVRASAAGEAVGCSVQDRVLKFDEELLIQGSGTIEVWTDGAS